MMQDYYGSQHSSRKWSTDFILRIVHAVLQIVAFAAGLTIGISLGWVTVDFENCVLYSSMELTKGANNTLSVDSDKTKWASQELCSFVTYTGVCAAIYSIIWCWFYLLISDWGSRLRVTGRPPDLNLLGPSIAISVVMFCCSIAAAGIVTRGHNFWCNSVEKSLRSIIKDNDNVHCSDIAHIDWTLPPRGKRAYPYLQATTAGVWIVMSSFALQSIIAGVRMKMFSSSYYWKSGFRKLSSENADISVAQDNNVNDSYEQSAQQIDEDPDSDESPSTVAGAVEVYSPSSSKA